jgi:hypothetical protein
LAAGVDVERNQLFHRNSSFWSQACVDPLMVQMSVRGSEEAPCHPSGDEWILSDAEAQDLFCSEYQ